MRVLFFCPFNFDIKSSNLDRLGGIETLNYELAKKLSENKNNEIFIATLSNKKIINKRLTNIPIKYLDNKNYNFDIIISSNYSKIFDKFPKAKNYLWLHNTLAIEKALRKKILFSILFNKVTALFVSNYLNKITSTFYFFEKRIILPNFLPSKFENQKKNFKRKKIFIWSVKRTKGLEDILYVWSTMVFPYNSQAKLYIFGIKKNLFKNDINSFKKKNIFFFGNVKKNKLRSIYNRSLAMICLGYDETFCLNALEANSCGLPIITYGKSALKNFTKNGKNGFIVKDHYNLGLKINNLCNSKINSKVINYCYKLSENFYLKNIIKKWAKLISNAKFN